MASKPICASSNCFELQCGKHVLITGRDIRKFCVTLSACLGSRCCHSCVLDFKSSVI